MKYLVLELIEAGKNIQDSYLLVEYNREMKVTLFRAVYGGEIVAANTLGFRVKKSELCRMPGIKEVGNMDFWEGALKGEPERWSVDVDYSEGNLLGKSAHVSFINSNDPDTFALLDLSCSGSKYLIGV